MNDTRLFSFEDDFVVRLQCVPMAVRFKLDLAGVKLTLRQWSRFTTQERRELLFAACQTPFEVGLYRDRLVELLARLGDAANPLPVGAAVPWAEDTRTPETIRQFSSSVGVTAPSDTAWTALTPLQRFVLLKLSRDNHDNVNFIPALKEFGLHDGRAQPMLASYAASA